MMEKINISKSAAPDLIPVSMLNMLAPELAPIVHANFTQSLKNYQGTGLWLMLHQFSRKAI